MKRTFLTALMATQFSLLAQTNTTVVPFGFENQFANGASDLFLTSETQDLFRGSYLATDWTTPVSITGIAMRLAPGAASFNAVMPSIDVRLSTSSRTPETMSPIYSINKGSDEVTVYSHTSVSLFAAANQPPAAFDLHFKFDQPFVYDPTKGSLLLDFRIGTPAPGGARSIDSTQVSPQLNGSPAAYFSGSPLTSFVLPAADIIQFQTVSVPEPTILWLSLMGTLWFLRRGLKGGVTRVAS